MFAVTDGTKLSQSTLKRIEDLLHVFEILNRSVHNRHNFKKHEGLQILVNVMKGMPFVSKIMSINDVFL